MLRQVRDSGGLLHFIREQDDRSQQMLERLCPTIGARQVELGARAIEQPVKVSRRFFQLLAIALASVFATVLVGIQSARQFQHAYIQAVSQEHFHGALGGRLARRVGVEIDHDRIAMAAEHADLPRCQGRAAGRDSIADAGPPDTDHVHVAFDKDRQIALAHRRARAVDVVQHRVLAVNRRLRRVQVLGLAVCLEAATAVADEIASVRVDWEHEPIAKARVDGIVPVGKAHQARLQHV